MLYVLAVFFRVPSIRGATLDNNKQNNKQWQFNTMPATLQWRMNTDMFKLNMVAQLRLRVRTDQRNKTTEATQRKTQTIIFTTEYCQPVQP